MSESWSEELWIHPSDENYVDATASEEVCCDSRAPGEKPYLCTREPGHGEPHAAHVFRPPDELWIVARWWP